MKRTRCRCQPGCPNPASIKLKVKFSNGCGATYDLVCIDKALAILESIAGLVR